MVKQTSRLLTTLCGEVSAFMTEFSISLLIAFLTAQKRRNGTRKHYNVTEEEVFHMRETVRHSRMGQIILLKRLSTQLKTKCPRSHSSSFILPY